MTRRAICVALAGSSMAASILLAAETKPAPAPAAAPAVAVADPPGAAGKTDDQKTLYALGVAISKNLGVFELTPADLEIVKLGLSEGMQTGKVSDAWMQSWGPKIQEMAQTRIKAGAVKEKERGAAFLAKAAAEPGFKKLPSGVLYKETQAGTGAQPKLTDKVKVLYKGTLIDGKMFDSRQDPASPAVFLLGSEVIPCWKDGVSQMKVGGKARLVCPADQAFGDMGAPPDIKPGATLQFEIELVGIEAPPAAPPAAEKPAPAPGK